MLAIAYVADPAKAHADVGLYAWIVGYPQKDGIGPADALPEGELACRVCGCIWSRVRAGGCYCGLCGRCAEQIRRARPDKAYSLR